MPLQELLNTRKREKSRREGQGCHSLVWISFSQRTEKEGKDREKAKERRMKEMGHLKREHERRKMCKDEEETLSFHGFIKAPSTDNKATVSLKNLFPQNTNIKTRIKHAEINIIHLRSFSATDISYRNISNQLHMISCSDHRNPHFFSVALKMQQSVALHN